MSFGYAFFVVGQGGRFKIKITKNQEELDEEEVDDGDVFIGEKVPLTEKTLAALKVLDHIYEIEQITGSNADKSVFELMNWLMERSNEMAFSLGRKIGYAEKSRTDDEIDKLIAGEL